MEVHIIGWSVTFSNSGWKCAYVRILPKVIVILSIMAYGSQNLFLVNGNVWSDKIADLVKSQAKRLRAYSTHWQRWKAGKLFLRSTTVNICWLERWVTVGGLFDKREEFEMAINFVTVCPAHTAAVDIRTLHSNAFWFGIWAQKDRE